MILLAKKIHVGLCLLDIYWSVSIKLGMMLKHNNVLNFYSSFSDIYHHSMTHLLEEAKISSQISDLGEI